MSPRKGVVRIVLSAASGLAVAMVVLSLVVDHFVVSDVREEMEASLDAICRDVDASQMLLTRCLEVFESRGEGKVRAATEGDVAALRATVMKACCRSWLEVVEGFMLCIPRIGDEIVSSGSPKASAGDRASVVIENFADVRRQPSGEYFTTRIYGEKCLCLIADHGEYRFISAWPRRYLSEYRRRPLMAVGFVLLTLVSAFTLVALRRAALLERLRGYIEGEKVRMQEDFAAAKLVQMSALPPPFPRQAAYSVQARMDPAKVVGGDFYDYQMLSDGCFYFLVADVAGKGISAAMFMMRAKSVAKQCLAETRSLSDGLTKANQLLVANNDSRLFVTVWVGILNPWTGRVLYVNAGHNPPIVRHADGSLDWVKCPPSLVLGLMPGVAYPVHELVLTPGDTLFLYTDGVTEGQDRHGRFYGERRLERTLSENAEDLVERVREDLDEFQGAAEPADDVTMVSLSYFGTPPGSARGFPCNREIVFVNSARFVERELDRVGCPSDVRKKFLLAFDEVGSNIISYSGAQYFTVKVSVEATPLAITLTLSDAGKPFNPLDKAAPDLSLPFEQRVSGGFGIFITRQLMDDVIYCRDEGRNVLTLRKQITPSEG